MCRIIVVFLVFFHVNIFPPAHERNGIFCVAIEHWPQLFCFIIKVRSKSFFRCCLTIDVSKKRVSRSKTNMMTQKQMHQENVPNIKNSLWNDCTQFRVVGDLRGGQRVFPFSFSWFFSLSFQGRGRWIHRRQRPRENGNGRHSVTWGKFRSKPGISCTSLFFVRVFDGKHVFFFTVAFVSKRVQDIYVRSSSCYDCSMSWFNNKVGQKGKHRHTLVFFELLEVVLILNFVRVHLKDQKADFPLWKINALESFYRSYRKDIEVKVLKYNFLTAKKSLLLLRIRTSIKELKGELCRHEHIVWVLFVRDLRAFKKWNITVAYKTFEPYFLDTY